MPSLEPDAADPTIVARCRAGRERGDVLPDAVQTRTADGAWSEPVEHPDWCLRGPDDLRAAAGRELAASANTATAVRLFVYSLRLRQDLVVVRTRDGDTQAWLMNGAGRTQPVDSLDDDSLAPVWLDARRRFARLMADDDRLAEAVEASREAWLADESRDVRAGMEHAELLVRAGELPEALAVWQDLHTAHPHFAPPLLRLADAMLELGVAHEDQEQLRIADALSELARRRFPDDASALAARGRFLWATSQPDEAATCFEAALAIDSDHAGAHYHLGLLAVARGDHAAAAESFRACLAADPDDAVARERLAESEAALRG